jgi:hypothetical protein
MRCSENNQSTKPDLLATTMVRKRATYEQGYLFIFIPQSSFHLTLMKTDSALKVYNCNIIKTLLTGVH